MIRYAPDGDAELPGELVDGFQVVDCAACGAVLKPDVVFFGGSVAEPTLADAFALADEGAALVVVGSSLAVYSGYRFVKRARERGVAVAVINDGPTRADPVADLLLPARAGRALSGLARALGVPVAKPARRRQRAVTMTVARPLAPGAAVMNQARSASPRKGAKSMLAPTPFRMT